MSDLNLCSRCGGPVPNGSALGGGCPRCMLELGFETTVGSRERAHSDIAAERPAVIGRYRIVRLIGGGGMGAVYEAEQDHPRRTVALKIIKYGMASPELLRRFEQESQALGRLQHPGIAQIYEAGTVDTGFGLQPYFAMEFIRGRSPLDFAEAKGLNMRERLQMMVKICDAVHHAHQRGLIHRDLKPGNILIDETGQPKILDFGVARVTDSDARATLQTNMGQLIGTLAYMSPEQALADPLDIDTRSDVYSLGVLLYELLSGRLPYTISKKVHEAIQAIREEDPAPLSTSNRMFRGDIETIVAKALEKDRGRRYVSAAEMAADIHRYLTDQPIVARPASRRYQIQKFAKRQKALVTGVAAVFVVLVAGIIVATTLFVYYRNAEQEALMDRDRANNSKLAETQALVRETDLRQVADDLRIQAEAQARVAKQVLSDLQVSQYFNNIALAEREGAVPNVKNSDRFLNETEVQFRNWEWSYLARRNHMEEAVLTGHHEAILAMVLDSDGKRLQTIGSDNTVKDWDLDARKETSTATYGGTVSDVILSANGRILNSNVGSPAASSSFTLVSQFQDLLTGKNVISLPSSPLGGPVALSPNGNLLVAAFITKSSEFRSTLRSWNIRTGVELPALGEYAGRITQLNFSPDGSRLAIVANASVRVLNVSSGQQLASFGYSKGTITATAFSQDGSIFVAGILNEGLRAWTIPGGAEIWTISTGNFSAVTLSPDSRYIATAAADQTIEILDSIRGVEVARLVGHSGPINALSFTSNGTELVSAGDDGLVHIWRVREQKLPLILNVGRIESPMRVSPDGNTLLTSTEHVVKSWATHTGQLRFQNASAESKVDMEFSQDGTHVVLLGRVPTNNEHGRLERDDLLVLDALTGREIAVLHSAREEVGNVAESDFWVSPDGGRVGLVSFVRPSGEFESSHSQVQIWDTHTGSRISSFRVDNAMHGRASVRFSTTGTLLALGVIIEGEPGLRRGVEIYDTTAGRRLHRLEITETGILVFSPVGDRLAVVKPGNVITIWDAETGAKLVSSREAGRTGTSIVDIAFSPDGTRLVSVSSNGEVWLWDAKTGKELIPLRESSGPYVIQKVTVVGEGIDEAYRLPPPEFRTASWKETAIFFSPDGRKITMNTVVQDTKGTTVVIETWDGSPRQK